MKDYSGYEASSLKEINAETAEHISSNVYWVLKSATSSSLTKRLEASSITNDGGTQDGNTYTFAGGYESAWMSIADGSTTTYTNQAKQIKRLDSSTASSVSYTGNATVGTSGSATTYTYPNGYMHVCSNVENSNYTTAYTVTYTVSSFDTSNLPTLYQKVDGEYHTYAKSWIKAAYTKSTLTVTGTDTGTGSATITFTPVNAGCGGTVTYTPSSTSSSTVTITPYGSGNTGGGSITYTPETTETVSAYTSLDTTYYVYSPSKATSTTKTFLTKADS